MIICYIQIINFSFQDDSCIKNIENHLILINLSTLYTFEAINMEL